MFNLNSLASMSLAQLKTMAAEHGIAPTGDKRKAVTWAVALFDRMEEVATVSKAKLWKAGQGFADSTKAAAAKVQEVTTSPEAKTQYVRILSITRYMGEQLAQGCELGLRATVWGLAYAATFTVWLALECKTSALWSPIDRSAVGLAGLLPSAQMREKLPVHGPALQVEAIHQAAMALTEAIAKTKVGAVAMA